MNVYLIAEINIIDPDLYQRYTQQAQPFIKKHGGKYLAATSDGITPLAGDWLPPRIVIIEFPSRQALDDCFNDPDYQPLAEMRRRSTKARSIIVPGKINT